MTLSAPFKHLCDVVCADRIPRAPVYPDSEGVPRRQPGIEVNSFMLTSCSDFSSSCVRLAMNSVAGSTTFSVCPGSHYASVSDSTRCRLRARRAGRREGNGLLIAAAEHEKTALSQSAKRLLSIFVGRKRSENSPCWPAAIGICLCLSYCYQKAPHDQGRVQGGAIPLFHPNDRALVDGRQLASQLSAAEGALHLLKFAHER